MSSKVKASYSLHPPPGTQTSSQLPSNSFEVPFKNGRNSSEYYRNLREAVVTVKSQFGSELTVWRDAIGNLESSKEAKNVKKGEEDEDEEGEEGEE